MIENCIVTTVGGRGYLGLRIFVCPEEVVFELGPCFLIFGFAIPFLGFIMNTPVLFISEDPLEIITASVMHIFIDCEKF